MKYVGLDVHKETCHATVMDESGEILKQGRFENNLPEFDAFLEGIDDASISMEATDAWQPIHDYLEERGFEVKLAHPYKTRIIGEAKIKTDCRDSEALAHLDRSNLLPEAYVPCKETRELRRKVKRRAKLVRERTKFGNAIRSDLRMRGIKTDERSLWTRKGKRWLKSLEIDAVDDYLSVRGAIDDRIRGMERELKREASEMEESKLLMTIPGIGYFSALSIIAEIGDVRRFPDAEKLCSYAGLVPSTDQSGSKHRHGSITKEGRPFLRWIMIQAAWNHIRHAEDSFLKGFYWRLATRKKKGVAITATARKLLKVVYWMLLDGEEFYPRGNIPLRSR